MDAANPVAPYSIYAVNDSLPVPSRRSLIRLSRFWAIASGALAGLCIASLFVWSANDASFRPALLQWEVSLGLKQMLLAGPNLGGDLGLSDPQRAIRWDGLGKRVIALHVLVWAGVAATALLAVLAFWPKKSSRRMLAAIGLVIGWGLLCGTQTLVDDWRARRQVAAIFPRIEAAGLALSREWPTESGRVPPDLLVGVDVKRFPDGLVVREDRERYSFREAMGPLVTRRANGVIAFSLAAAFELSVEYHPHGTLPAAHLQVFYGIRSPPVSRYYRLKENWYLVRYGGM